MTRSLDRISINPAVMNGQPCVAGTRITVRRVLELIALYPDRAALKAEFPELTDEDIAQALSYAVLSIDDQVQPLEAA